jgi:hypothetical protein
MNPIHCGYSKCLFIAMLAGAFLISSEMPLLAQAPQSGQSNASQSSATPPSTGQSNTEKPSTAESNNTTSQKDDVPDAPQAQPPQNTQQQPASTPSGAAGAKAADVKGAPAAQPAGAAVAPVRQRGHRSLLIKIGLLAGAGIAVGSAVALSERSPSRPPGTSSPAQR